MQKLGNGPEVGKCPAPGQCKICKCPNPETDKAGKCPVVARGEGGGWAQVELTDALLYPMFLCNFSWQFSDTRCTKHCQVENAMKWSCLKAYWLQPPLGWRITFCCNIFFFTRVQWNCQWVRYTWWCSLVWAAVKATVTHASNEICNFVLLMDNFGITSSGYFRNTIPKTNVRSFN